MHRYGNGQIRLSDFQQPMTVCFWADNRWVKKAQSIPWDKLEAKYANLFPSGTGSVAQPLQLTLGACLIHREFGYSDEEIVMQQRCHDCGRALRTFQYPIPPDVSLLNEARENAEKLVR